MRTQTHLQDSVPQKPIAWRALEQARKQVPRVSPLQQPPIFHAHHTISQEPDHPASLFLPLVAALISSFPSRRRRFGKAISKNIAKTASSVFGRTGVRLALLLLPIEEFETCVAEILAHSLRWSVEHLSSVGDEGIIDVSSLSILSEPASQWWKHRYSSRFLASLLKAGKSAAHGAESLITVFIQRHLCSPAVIRLVCALFETMPMKVSQSHYLFRFRKPTDHSR